MLPRDSDPIVAIATASGRGAIGIVRVSGADVTPIARALCDRLLRPRVATYLPFVDADGAAIDHGLAIHFPAPHSFTGEDVFELHAHGGTVVLQLLLRRCLQAGSQLGLRLAQPGEFTRRAFLNGKLDLAQAEAIADLIDASTETAARSATRSLSGAFSAEVQRLLQELTDLRLLVEATLDFPEEEIDVLDHHDVRGRLSALQHLLDQTSQKATQGALLREGIKVVIAGRPNAGKSSLLNALAGAELAIVSPIAGTTRDKIQQTIQIEGVPVHVIDTAGLRDSTDEVEQQGVARAWDEIAGADALVFLHDLSNPDDKGPGSAGLDGQPLLGALDRQIAARIASRLSPMVPVIDVWNKVDTVSDRPSTSGDLTIHLSAKTGEGLDVLRRALLRVAGWQPASEGLYMARERHVQALSQVKKYLAGALAHMSGAVRPLDLIAEELRLAQNALSEITGVFDADDLLGAIFSRFCIGK